MSVDPPPEPPVRGTPWRGRLKRVGIALGVVVTFMVLLCCCGFGYLGYDAHRAPHEEQAMEAFATDLCRDLVDGRADAVYAAMSADARRRYSAEALAEGLAERHLTRCEVTRAAYVFLLAAYVEIADDTGAHSIDLVTEAGAWLVAGDLLHDLDSAPTHHRGGHIHHHH